MHSNGTRDVLVVSRVVNLCASFSAHFWWLWGVKEHGKFKCKQKGIENLLYSPVSPTWWEFNRT